MPVITVQANNNKALQTQQAYEILGRIYESTFFYTLKSTP